MLTRERDKLERALGGIKDMGGTPDRLFVVDTNKESIAVKEARRLNIPVVAVLDTNCDPDTINYPIPGNDDAARAIALYCELVAKAAIDGIARQQGGAGVDLGAAVEAPVEPALAAEEEAAAEPAAQPVEAPGEPAKAEAAPETEAAPGEPAKAEAAPEAEAAPGEPAKAEEGPAAPAEAEETPVADAVPAAEEETGEAEQAPLFAAPEGEPDDLKKISGVGPVLEKKLHALGITKFDQVAGFSAEEIVKVDDALNFKGRIERDDWIGQAKALAAGE
jgi:small subunit ribosomal protein S2